jgi:hypothetical protein
MKPGRPAKPWEWQRAILRRDWDELDGYLTPRRGTRLRPQTVKLVACALAGRMDGGRQVLPVPGHRGLGRLPGPQGGRRRGGLSRAAHKAAYNDTAYRKARAIVRAIGPACWLYGQPSADTLDHVTPLAAGGANVPSNWAPAHKSCNSRRGSPSTNSAQA